MPIVGIIYCCDAEKCLKQPAMFWYRSENCSKSAAQWPTKYYRRPFASTLPV